MTHYLFFFVSMTILAYSVISQDVVFPKVEEEPHLSGNNPMITERIPVYIPDRCPENMLLYPGSGDRSTWICDCKPGYLFFPYNETCVVPYSEGPCGKGNYVWLREGGSVPICIANTCADVPTNRVPYNGKCYTLGSTDQQPCGLHSMIFVNRTTFQLQCTEIPPPATELLITAPKLTPNPCPHKGHRVKSVCRCPI